MRLSDAAAQPCVVAGQRLLYLPATAEAWDVEIEDRTLLSIRPGLYRLDLAPPRRARMLRDLRWLRVAEVASPPVALDERILPSPPAATVIAVVAPSTPDTHYLAGEELLLQMIPAAGGFHELSIKAVDGDDEAADDAGASGPGAEGTIVQGNRRRLKRGLVPGRYAIRTRWLPDVAGWNGDAARWTAWSRPLSLTVWRKRDEADAIRARIAGHRLSLMADRAANGVLTVTDPWALPPGCPEQGDVRWFRTPCYDGSSMLINELPAYYRDPWQYYVDGIAALIARGFAFRAWNELIDDPAPHHDREIVLQLDLDAGPRSFARIYRQLRAMGVRASAMVHRRCEDWYAYAIEDLDIDLLRDAAGNGWTIGYHNNSIGNVQRLERAGDYGEAVLLEAERRFAQDVDELRQWFDIRVFTHHGGNALNHRTPVPIRAEVVCVDKTFNPELWRTIARSFSDGGFQSRPKPLHQRLAEFDRGRFFIRNHPLKYANYHPDFDVPPLVARDIERVGGEVTPDLERRIEPEVQKQSRWLDDRLAHRMGQRVSRASHHKPLTARMRDRAEIAPVVERLYAGRGARFVRQSPWPWGDPRVYWWRLLDAFAPKQGRILNVGALQPDRRAETTDFVGAAEVLEMDIDPARQPDILGDVANPPGALLGSFDGVLLFGLTVIHSPSRAVEACRQLMAPGGVSLLGFAADTHPLRGGMWDPVMRPVWRRDREPLGNIGLKGHMWSFTEQSIHELFADWNDVQFEFFSDMFYVVARRNR